MAGRQVMITEHLDFLSRTENDVECSEKQIKEIIEAAGAAVVGYEKYLLNKIDYKDLAIIMKLLRETLPKDFNDIYKD